MHENTRISNKHWQYHTNHKRDKVLMNEPSKICGRQPLEIWSVMVCLNRPYPFKFFKSCLPQILLGSFLNTLFQMKKKDHWISSTLSKSFIWFLLKISWTRSIGSIYISKLLAINCWLSNHIDRCWSHVLRVGKKQDNGVIYTQGNYLY